ncbi:MAG: hypothetical protein RJB66_1279 [Pseudomonadota bacterium]
MITLDSDLDEKLKELVPDYSSYRILRQSVDARRRQSEPLLVYSVEVAEAGETLLRPDWQPDKISPVGVKPIIIGSGPAGLFCALRLVERGVACRLFERGSKAEMRMKGINQFWRYGKLDRRNNVCFGEGGAGLYSDGKLITRIKSPHIPYVLRRLVDFGAPGEIEFLANPHVGSDRLRRVIPKLRQFLIDAGCEIHFDTQVTEIKTQNKQVTGVRTEYGEDFDSPMVVVATGHSAEDMLYHLNDIGVTLEGKSYALGLRIEHPQAAINKIQYRDYSQHPKLGAANYKLAHHDKKTDVGVYSFCMCPGGYVLSAGTDEDGLVCNGMSNYKRNSAWANSAIVVSIDHDRLFKQNLFGGLEFRRALERKAKSLVVSGGGTKQLPAQNLQDFIDGKTTQDLLPTSSPSGALSTRLDQLLPESIRTRMIEGLLEFNKNMRGFISPQAQLFAIESRTSCPVRVVRDAVTLQSLSHQGLYPAGEGAGYAGGITSAACDGVRIADSIIDGLASQSVSKN